MQSSAFYPKVSPTCNKSFLFHFLLNIVTISYEKPSPDYTLRDDIVPHKNCQKKDLSLKAHRAPVSLRKLSPIL